MNAAEPIVSPCTKVCIIEPATGFCLGCKRTLREIAAWGSMPATMRSQIMAELGARILRRDSQA